VESIGQANSVIESFAHNHGLGAGSKCFELVPRSLLALTFGRVYTVATWGNVNCRNQVSMTGLRSQRSMKRGFTLTPVCSEVTALFKGGQ
jgi:hypothetical protein